MKMSAHILSLMLAAFLLTGCETVGSLFGDDSEAPLPGERISVLQLQKELVPSTDLQATPVVLSEPWDNQFWPQAGGYPSHAMGHLALGPSLKRAWKVSIGKGGNRRRPLTAAPIVAENTVYTLDTDGDISAFDLKTGARKWRESAVPAGEEDSGAVGGGLAYADGKIFATCGYKFLTAINPASGKAIWRAAIPAPGRAAPAVFGDKVFLITLDNRLVVHSAADGALLWKHDGVSETTNMLGSAAVAADNGLAVLPLSSGELYGLDPETGRVLWQDNLSSVRRATSLSSMADIRGLPVIDQGSVYAVSYSGRMAALDEATGQRLWQREIGSAETPWAAGDSIFLMTTDQQLTALSRQTGGIHWVTQLPRHRDNDKGDPIVWTGPVLAGGRLFVASSGGDMIEADPVTGKIIKKADLGGDVMTPPVVAAGTLLVLTTDGELSAFR